MVYVMGWRLEIALCSDFRPCDPVLHREAYVHRGGCGRAVEGQVMGQLQPLRPLEDARSCLSKKRFDGAC